jgi:hypothetical protein
VTQDESRCQCWGPVRRRPSSGENHDVGEIHWQEKQHVERRCACRKRSMCKADVHAGEATRARQTHMQKRKACEACMQEDLAMIGLGFW